MTTAERRRLLVQVQNKSLLDRPLCVCVGEGLRGTYATAFVSKKELNSFRLRAQVQNEVVTCRKRCYGDGFPLALLQDDAMCACYAASDTAFLTGQCACVLVRCACDKRACGMQ